jgi:hypothetical protein
VSHATWSALGPRCTRFGRYAGASSDTRRAFGSRSVSTSSATRPSRRASEAPMQKCGPRPKERCCGWGERWSSKRSGSAAQADDRLLAAEALVERIGIVQLGRGEVVERSRCGRHRGLLVVEPTVAEAAEPLAVQASILSRKIDSETRGQSIDPNGPYGMKLCW